MNELREEIELPPLDITREDREGNEYLIPTIVYLHELACRERQLKSSLAANREQKAELSAALAAHGKTLLSLNKAAFETIPALEAEIGEQKAEIDRLKACTQLHSDSAVEAWQLTQKWQKRVFDLEAGKRASVGEKWIDVKQELPPESEPLLIVYKGVVQHLTYTLYEGGWYPHHEDPDDYSPIEDGEFVTHYRRLPAPPTLPGEEK